MSQYVRGRQRIVEHVGSAHTEAELGLLLERAGELLENPAQGVLELSVEPRPSVKGLVVPAGTGLIEAAGAVTPAGRDSPGRVVGTDSRILFDALANVFTALGFDGLDDEVFRDLVVARVVEPTSLLDAGRVLRDLGQLLKHQSPASYATMKRALGRTAAGKYRDRIATWCFQHASTSGDVSLVLYDVTTLYSEAEKEDELRKVGYSKEPRVDPQIVVGLLVDPGGFPLEIGCVEGNKAETSTMIPIIQQFQARHSLADMVVVADAGMLSAGNLRELDEANLRFIVVGSRMTKAPADLDPHFRWHGDAFTNGQLIDTITPRTGHTKENDPDLRAEPVWDPDTHSGSWRAVWAYSRKRAVRDATTLTAQENRAREVIEGQKAARVPRFVKTAGDKRSLDEASLTRAPATGRPQGLHHKYPSIGHGASEVIGSYHDLWHVEQSFRMSKTDLRARPMFHRTRDAIEAH